MKNNEKLIDLEEAGIYPEHLQLQGHRAILMAMNYLSSKGQKADAMSIMEILPSGQTKKSVEELGGLDYLLTLQDSFVQEDNLPIFVEKIKQSYTRKLMLDVAEEVKELVLSEKSEVMNPAELIAFVEDKISDANIESTDSEEVYKMGENTEERLKARAERPSEVPGLEVGWEEYDRVTGGARDGDLIIVAAPSKTGKSVTLTNWAKKIAIVDKLPVLYIDTEMGSEEQEDRLLASLSGVPHHEIISGMFVKDTQYGLAEDKTRLVKEAIELMKSGNYHHIQLPQFTIEKVMALAKHYQKKHGIVALFFDYIKVPSNQADSKSMQEYQKLGFFTSGLKDLASILKIPVFSACQTNRANDATNDEPSEADIGGSYRILQLASKLMFLYNKSDEEIAREGLANGNQKLFIKWQRNGASNVPPINIMFHKEIIRQEEC